MAVIDTTTTLFNCPFIGDSMGDNAVISNVLYKGTQGTTSIDYTAKPLVNGFYGTVSDKATIENVVVIVDRKSGSTSDPVSQSVVDCDSLYVVTNKSKGSTDSLNVHYYASEADMKLEVTAVPDSFDLKIWAIDNGNLVFASMIEE